MESGDDLFIVSKDERKTERDQKIRNHLGLVRCVADRYMGRGIAEEDLFQIGVIGLIKAIDRFDEKKGVKFSTYAVPFISGEIKGFFREDGLIKVSRKIKEDGMKIRRVSAAFESEHGRAPTLEEVEYMTNLKQDEILMAFEAGEEIRDIYEEEGNYIYHHEDETEKVLDRMFLGQLMQLLNDMERKILIMRYFEEITQAETAKRLSLSQVQVCRMEKKILQRLRACAF